MLVYDNDGLNMKEPRGKCAQAAITQVATDLFKTLFAEGMTNLEARALASYLTTQVEFALCVEMSLNALEKKL